LNRQYNGKKDRPTMVDKALQRKLRLRNKIVHIELRNIWKSVMFLIDKINNSKFNGFWIAEVEYQFISHMPPPYIDNSGRRDVW
jgi:hypothetical protein